MLDFFGEALLLAVLVTVLCLCVSFGFGSRVKILAIVSAALQPPSSTCGKTSQSHVTLLLSYCINKIFRKVDLQPSTFRLLIWICLIVLLDTPIVSFWSSNVTFFSYHIHKLRCSRYQPVHQVAWRQYPSSCFQQGGKNRAVSLPVVPLPKLNLSKGAKSKIQGLDLKIKMPHFH